MEEEGPATKKARATCSASEPDSQPSIGWAGVLGSLPSWHRPSAEPLVPGRDDLAFQQMDIDYVMERPSLMFPGECVINLLLPPTHLVLG
jgi:hypothetical protein